MINDKYLVDTLNRFERLKEYALSYVYSNDIPKDEIIHIKDVLNEIEQEIHKVKGRYVKYMQEYQQVREDKVSSGVFSAEFDDKDNPFNDREQLDDYNAQIVKILNNQIDEFEKYIKMFNQPYFGSMELNMNNRGYKLYIGRSGYSNSQGKNLIVDWRAPISSSFYSPDNNTDININGVDVKVKVDKKSYFEIARGSILSIYTPKSGNKSADLFLENELNKKVSSKLSDIITTIQDKQNQIIRYPIDKPMIIQGVAGSGKSTILFHRLAYLVYNYKDKFKSDNSLLIVPNNIFKKYTQDIIPSLGLIGLKVDTLLSFYREYMHLPKNFIMESNSEMKDIDYNSILNDSKYIFERYIEIVIGYVLEKFPELKESVENYKMKVLGNTNTPYYERLHILCESAVNEYVLKTFSKSSEDKQNAKIDKYMEMCVGIIDKQMNVIKVQDHFIKNSDIYNEVERLHHINKGITKYIKDLEQINQEDEGIGNLPYYLLRKDYSILMLLYSYIYGLHDKYDLIGVDEAQEIDQIDVYILSRIVKKYNLVFAGDVSQVLSERKINDWKDIVYVLNNVFEQEVEVKYLDVSYRSTKEIVDVVNNISKSFVKQSISGQFSIEGSYEVSTNIVQSLKKVILDKYNNMAIIVKNDMSMDSIKLELKKHDLLDLFNNTWGDGENDFGMWLLTPELARGLEFDAVLLYGFDIDHIDNVYEYNQLYVAMTRAMKKLIMIK